MPRGMPASKCPASALTHPVGGPFFGMVNIHESFFASSPLMEIGIIPLEFPLLHRLHSTPA